MQEDQNPLFFLGVPRGNHEAPIFFLVGLGVGGGGVWGGGEEQFSGVFVVKNKNPLYFNF